MTYDDGSMTCDERIIDYEHFNENMDIWNTYGSELAGDFGTIPCGQPVVRGTKCDLHKRERRSDRGDRRRPGSTDSDKLF